MLDVFFLSCGSGFALTPVSGGHPVALERGWKRAWHGSSLHRIERIAVEGLSVGQKGPLGALKWL